MKLLKSLVVVTAATSLLGLAGCGSSSRESSKSASFAESQSCIGCHSTKTSPVTGAVIAEEWQRSVHNTKNGASCPDCHKPTGHPNGGITSNPLDTVCGDCHTFASMRTGSAHFGGYTTNREKAAYLTTTDVSANSQCRVCHNPHDTTSLIGINQQWAASPTGHGAVNSLTFTEDPWKVQSSGACSRCHTSTGYVYYMTSPSLGAGFKVIPKSAFGKYTTSREVVGCKACHSDYSWAKRTSSFANWSTPYAVTATMTRTFPANQGDSNMCIPCHAGRESGESVKAIADFTNVSFKNPHYLAAAGVFYQKAGYHYLAASKYINTWSHGNIGVNNYVTSGGQATGNGGPCVACHMNGSHTFSPIDVAKSTGATGCYGCHSGEDITLLIEEEKELFDRGMDFFSYTLGQNGINYNDAYPYFFKTATDTSSANAVKNWTFAALVGPATGTGANNMGAAFNFKLLKAEKGSHVHNRAYMRRLMSDSIQYLQTGTVLNRATSSPYTISPISFTSYSTYRTATPDGNPVGITTLKDWLQRRVNADGTSNASGLYWGLR